MYLLDWRKYTIVVTMNMIFSRRWYGSFFLLMIGCAEGKWFWSRTAETAPVEQPSNDRVLEPSQPTSEPENSEPTSEPSAQPTSEPESSERHPTVTASSEPTSEPTNEPTSSPTTCFNDLEWMIEIRSNGAATLYCSRGACFGNCGSKRAPKTSLFYQYYLFIGAAIIQGNSEIPTGAFSYSILWNYRNGLDNEGGGTAEAVSVGALPETHLCRWDIFDLVFTVQADFSTSHLGRCFTVR